VISSMRSRGEYMDTNDFLDSISKESRPEPNVDGDFDCFQCGERVFQAFLDRAEGNIIWYCSENHVSSMKARF